MPQLYAVITDENYRKITEKIYRKTCTSEEDQKFVQRFSPRNPFIGGEPGPEESYRLIAGNNDSADLFVKRYSTAPDLTAFVINHDVAISGLLLMTGREISYKQKMEVFEGKAVLLQHLDGRHQFIELHKTKIPKVAKLEERVMEGAAAD